MRESQDLRDFQSWGRYPVVSDQTPARLARRADALPDRAQNETFLPYGMGRSYGDSCLNANGTLLLTRALDHLIAFDPVTGALRAEAGVTLDEILRFCVPRGYFLPVTPGTKYVTLGGAVANDVHGKNHHVDGNFSHHVHCFELLRSTGERLLCSRESNPGFFHATIGGLGLTGLITWVEIKLMPITSSFITREIIKTGGLRDFFALTGESDGDYRYTVSWVDCLARGAELGRGFFIRGNHARGGGGQGLVPARETAKSVPFDFPSWALNGTTVRIFNSLYYHRQLGRRVAGSVHFDPFFYPLDSVRCWNRIYGRRGFLQWQCVLPGVGAQPEGAIEEILRQITKSGLGSFLAVLKTFGAVPSLGMMSFARQGLTLALDFPNSGPDLFRLLDRLDSVTRECRGAVYAAKDARMSRESFLAFYPRAREFAKFKDPAFSSSFWRRVFQGEDE